MKKVSFLVALLAITQIAIGQRNAQAQQRLPSDRTSVEETLDHAGHEVAEELERLAQELGGTAEKLSQTLEHWAEEHSQELDNWSEKYAKQWEAWGNRFEQKLERMAHEQDGIWKKWSSKYEQQLNQWVRELESEDMNPELVGEFVERNLDMISKMPLGQLVDEVLKDGIGELSDAPWESLEELGALAKSALEEPAGEIAELLNEGSDQRRALEHRVRELGDALNRLNDDVRRDHPVADPQTDGPVERKVDPRIEALKKLRQRADATPEQRQRIDQIIRTLIDVEDLKNGSRFDPPADRPRMDVPHGDQIKQKVEREKNRQDQTLKQFNDDLRRSSEESRKSLMKARELENRQPLRVDGKRMDADSKPKQKSAQNPANRVLRDGRLPKNASGQSSKRDTRQNSQTSESDSDLELLRKEIQKLRDEVKRLQEESDK